MKDSDQQAAGEQAGPAKSGSSTGCRLASEQANSNILNNKLQFTNKFKTQNTNMLKATGGRLAGEQANSNILNNKLQFTNKFKTQNTNMLKATGGRLAGEQAQQISNCKAQTYSKYQF
ncbi:MAG: hypothetical protein GY868_16185 [Deltaproteobacteria bacterium]|nr:hypothetical protein [Deltaproteobacteria bacterium]